MKGKNWASDQEMHESSRSFSLEEALLSARNYKVIFALSVLVIMWRMVLEIPDVFNWQLAGWQHAVHFVLFKTTEIIMGCVVICVPIMLRIRAKVTHALQENIQKLAEAISVREQISTAQETFHKE
ncbi:hypothetical protein [Bartonella sp. MM73XJBT]|uniref:hypothetical protein n=1 Tax=Bartonella sp. MM73XJBT TaxID=3019095 RepID=UPI00235EB4F6|nr:hypothetical protein [Bartonella sp. MM73XJBT]